MFDRWYMLFVASVDEGWQGPMVEKAKAHAAWMASMLARKVAGADWEVPAGPQPRPGRAAIARRS